MTWIYYASKLYAGRNVDIGILKKEFPPGKGWFSTKKNTRGLGLCRN
jgi:hypothetical protein